LLDNLTIVVVYIIFVTTIIYFMTAIKKIHSDFQKIFSLWQSELEKYSDSDLKRQISPDTWTLGQVYNHLINSTLGFHLKQVEFCLTNSAEKNQSKNFKGFLAYHVLNGFPPIKIKVPASDFYTPKHPNSKEEILVGFKQVEKAMQELVERFATNQEGKTIHPGFSYLSAKEWYKLVEMHWRHHLRQKKELDNL
jgi:hypothetical protein